MAITFEPWVGRQYRNNSQFGLRVLILGESHYGHESELKPTFTSGVVRALAQKYRHAFFTKISKLLLGLDGKNGISDKARGDVWEHVAFYNYIQCFVSTDPRVRPTDAMWLRAKEPFLEVIEMLKPNVILVLGRQLARNLPEVPANIEICKIQHPSTGFSYQKWNPVFLESLERAKNNG